MTVDKHIIIYQLAVSEDDISMSYINISMFTQHVSCSLFEEGLYWLSGKYKIVYTVCMYDWYRP